VVPTAAPSGAISLSEATAQPTDVEGSSEICQPGALNVLRNGSSNHRFRFQVRYSSLEPVPDLMVGLWTDDPASPRLLNREVSCTTRQDGTCSTPELAPLPPLPQIFYGTVAAGCVNLLRQLPQEPQDVTIELIITR